MRFFQNAKGNRAAGFLVSALLLMLLLPGCGGSSKVETHPIPFGDELNALSQQTTSPASSVDASGNPVPVAPQPAADPLEGEGPGREYIEATTSDDRAIAASEASRYITQESASTLDKLELRSSSPYGNYWDLPSRFDQYEVVGELLVFEASCDGEEIPYRIALIKEGKTWTVKNFAKFEVGDGQVDG